VGANLTEGSIEACAANSPTGLKLTELLIEAFTANTTTVVNLTELLICARNAFDPGVVGAAIVVTIPDHPLATPTDTDRFHSLR
jgi:hypothetical protein